jgi:RNA processing factor Prp31
MVKRTRKIQSKIEPELEVLVKQQRDFKSTMSNYVRDLLIKKTKFKPAEQQ